MKHLLLIASTFIAIQATAQNNPVIVEKTITASGPKDDGTGKSGIYNYVEQMPSSAYDYKKYIAENLRHPNPEVVGRVIVKFVVNEDGHISDVTLVRGIGGGCDEEAVRVIKNMPAWKPGKQNGKPVKVWFTMPIAFVASH